MKRLALRAIAKPSSASASGTARALTASAARGPKRRPTAEPSGKATTTIAITPSVAKVSGWLRASQSAMATGA